jgi:hypothetical protein
VLPKLQKALTTDKGQGLNESELHQLKNTIINKFDGISTRQAKAVLNKILEEIDELSIVSKHLFPISDHGNT